MSPTAGLTLQFVLCAAVILFAGVRLSRYGEVIARRTGVGGTWFGVVAMSAVTSLPELVTGASSILVFAVADIAAGDVIGSCMVNLVVLALLDVRDPDPLTARVHRGHVLVASFGILLFALAGLAILAGQGMPTIAWFGVHSLLFLAVYALAMHTIFHFEKRRMAEATGETAEAKAGEPTLRRAVVLYALNALLLFAAATWLPGVAERFSEETGVAQGFVGTVFVAIATSLPEIVVSVAAARIGALDMAVGNLFGSNLFNIAVLGFDDLLYTRGSLLADVSATHLYGLAGATAMSAVAVIGLTYRAERKRWRLSWGSLAMIVIWGAVLILLSRA